MESEPSSPRRRDGNFARSVPLSLRRDLDLSGDAGDRLALIIESLSPYIDTSAIPTPDARDSINSIDAALERLERMPENEMLQTLGRMLCSGGNTLELKKLLLSAVYETLRARQEPGSAVRYSGPGQITTASNHKRRQCYIL